MSAAVRLPVLILIVTACGSPSSGDSDAAGGDDAPPPDDGTVAVTLPPANAKADYQLGGAYTPPAGVMVVVRDRKAPRVGGLYNICYVNGFQIQPDQESYWVMQHPDLILRDASGTPIRDPQWNEMLLDTRLAEKRAAIGSVVGQYITACIDGGFDAIEIDNLDSYTRSQGLLTQEGAVLTMKQFSAAAHKANKAIAQKNAAALLSRKAELGTDFAIVEECNRYAECDAFTTGYGDHVIAIEYRQQDFDAGCGRFPNLSIVLRDVNLVTPAQTGYLYNGC